MSGLELIPGFLPWVKSREIGLGLSPTAPGQGLLHKPRSLWELSQEPRWIAAQEKAPCCLVVSTLVWGETEVSQMPSEEEMTYQADLPRCASVICRKQKRAREKVVCKLLAAKLSWDLMELLRLVNFCGGAGVPFSQVRPVLLCSHRQKAILRILSRVPSSLV